MIQLAEPLDAEPANIAARIAENMQPWRIVLFGSRTRGDARNDSDVDIYVEIDLPPEQLRDVHERILALFVGRSWGLDVKVCQRGEIERRRDDPGTIEWDVAREGVLLYAHDSAS
jgi:predicted nucleotidyltransferase